MQCKLYGYEYIVTREMEHGLGGVSDTNVKEAIIANINKSKKKIESLKSFVKNIPDFLPCDVCASHAQKFIDDNQPPLENLQSSDDLFIWSIDFHNHANKLTNKKELTHKEATDEFNKYWSLQPINKDTQDTTNISDDIDIAILSIGIVLIVCVVILLIVSTYYYLK
jgi:hypothetical protein